MGTIKLIHTPDSEHLDEKLLKAFPYDQVLRAIPKEKRQSLLETLYVVNPSYAQLPLVAHSFIMTVDTAGFIDIAMLNDIAWAADAIRRTHTGNKEKD